MPQEVRVSRPCHCRGGPGTRNKMIGDSNGQVLGFWTTKKVILNEAGAHEPSIGRSSGKPSAKDLAQSLKRKILTLKAQFINEGGTQVNYEAMRNSIAFEQYVQHTSQLSTVALDELSNGGKKAFFINIYNALILHAMASDVFQVDWKGMTMCRLVLYASASYCIGGEVFSLNDIENGILRGNRVSPVPFTKPPFAIGDPRLRHCLDCDPRIHFALNCGAKSCPPYAYYDEEKIDSQLDVATQNFISSEVTLPDAASGDPISLSKLFEWYKNDFESDTKPKGEYSDVLLWIKSKASSDMAERMNAQGDLSKLSVQTRDYDLSVND